jgi:hypothetical protein
MRREEDGLGLGVVSRWLKGNSSGETQALYAASGQKTSMLAHVSTDETRRVGSGLSPFEFGKAETVRDVSRFRLGQALGDIFFCASFSRR